MKALFCLLFIIIFLSKFSLSNEKEKQIKNEIYKEIYQEKTEKIESSTNNEIYQIKINKIIIKGNKNIPTNTILETINIKDNSTLKPEDIQIAVNRIYEMGYFSDIEVNFEPSNQDQVNIVFYLLENPVVKTVKFIGNKILSELDLIEIINTRPGKIMNYNVIREDIIQINEEYNKMGYVGVKNHVQDIQIKEDGTLIFYIQEAIYPKKINIIGNKIIPTNKLQNLLLIKPNNPLKKEELENTLNKIYEFYQEEGYMLADVRSNIDYENNIINIEVYEAILEDIEVEGNTKTKKYVIEKMLELEKGKVIKSFKLKRSLRKMQLGGYFKNVEPDFRGGSEPGKVILVLKVEEQQTGQVVLGVGFGGLPGSNRGGIAGSFSISEINYKGKGQQVYLNWERGNLINSISLSFSDPFSLSNNRFYGFNIQSTELFQQRALVNTNPQTIALYKDYRRNYGFFFGKKLIDKDLSYSFNVSMLTFKTSPTPSNENPFVLPSTKGDYISLGASIIKDSRDDEFYPTKGVYSSVSADQGIRNSGNLRSFSRISGEYRKYYSFKNERVLAIRGFVGIATNSTPFVYQYTLGGSDTLRGYDFNRFLGNRAFMINVEYRFPLSKKLENFYGAAFIDWGGAFPPNQKISLARMGLNYGVGIRFILPQFGSIRLDYAISNEKSKIAVGIGQMF
ncbi:MAG: POTRA domain-containing protein [Candidatus Calescibacterium sp.]|nr:BamA/TamA family outer membrane protein [Candidatus Calescibacterium sp.]MDW8132906.1 POTRA domain-containing protein [Candidatus Calescibacterium sp.]